MATVDKVVQLSKEAEGFYTDYNAKRVVVEAETEALTFHIGKSACRFKVVNGEVTLFLGNVTLNKKEAIELAEGILATLGGREA